MSHVGGATGHSVWTVVVAAGAGQRFGSPKQYELLGSTRVLDVAVATARTVSDGVVVVVPPADAEAEGAVAGGATRSESVRAGLRAVARNAGIICVHDAARPLASTALMQRLVAAVEDGAEAVLPGLPVTDTIKRVVDGVVQATVDRRELVAVQTPQVFRLGALRAAHAAGAHLAEDERTAASDDAGLVERLVGLPVHVVPGEDRAMKITTVTDLALVETMLAQGTWS